MERSLSEGTTLISASRNASGSQILWRTDAACSPIPPDGQPAAVFSNFSMSIFFISNMARIARSAR